MKWQMFLRSKTVKLIWVVSGYFQRIETLDVRRSTLEFRIHSQMQASSVHIPFALRLFSL